MPEFFSSVWFIVIGYLCMMVIFIIHIIKEEGGFRDWRDYLFPLMMTLISPAIGTIISSIIHDIYGYSGFVVWLGIKIGAWIWWGLFVIDLISWPFVPIFKKIQRKTKKVVTKTWDKICDKWLFLRCDVKYWWRQKKEEKTK